MGETIVPEPTVITTDRDGAKLYTQWVDRTMIYYPVTEIELKTLSRLSHAITFCFSVGGAAAGFALDSLREIDVSATGSQAAEAAKLWANASWLVALPFLAGGVFFFFMRRGVVEDVRQARTEGTTTP